MKWLIYSELERSRKSAVLSVIFTVLAVGIFVLIALSFNYGNLGKLPIEAKESFYEQLGFCSADCDNIGIYR